MITFIFYSKIGRSLFFFSLDSTVGLRQDFYRIVQSGYLKLHFQGSAKCFVRILPISLDLIMIFYTLARTSYVAPFLLVLRTCEHLHPGLVKLVQLSIFPTLTNVWSSLIIQWMSISILFLRFYLSTFLFLGSYIFAGLHFPFRFTLVDKCLDSFAFPEVLDISFCIAGMLRCVYNTFPTYKMHSFPLYLRPPHVRIKIPLNIS